VGREKNSIAAMEKNPENFDISLVSCKGSDCLWWDSGCCTGLYNVEKYGGE
jgi:hypothetical protein